MPSQWTIKASSRDVVVRGEVYADGRLVAAAQGTITIVAPRG